MCETIYYRVVEYDDDLIRKEQKRKIVNFKKTWTLVVCLFVCFNIQNNMTTFNAVRQKNVTCNRTDLLKSRFAGVVSFVQPSVLLVKVSYPLTQNGSKE